MFIKLSIIVAVMAAVTILFWIHADKIHESHRTTKQRHPWLFKITGFNEKHLDNPERWIRLFRIQLILMNVFFICVFWILLRN